MTTVNYNPSLLRFETMEMDDVIDSPTWTEELRRLTLGRPSGMNAALDYYQILRQTQSVDALAVVAKYPWYDFQAIGWLLFTYENDGWNLAADKEKTRAGAQVYIQQNFRRHGIGSRLIRMAAALAMPDPLRVYHWSNYDFFDPLMKQHSNICSADS
jgi:GNAT superfamily N-acetyltransferase